MAQVFVVLVIVALIVAVCVAWWVVVSHGSSGRTWVKHEGQNCYPGSGGDSVGSDARALSLAACKKACADTPLCNAIVRPQSSDASLQPCFLRTNVRKIEGCCEASPTEYNTYVSSLQTAQAQCADIPVASPYTQPGVGCADCTIDMCFRIAPLSVIAHKNRNDRYFKGDLCGVRISWVLSPPPGANVKVIDADTGYVLLTANMTTTNFPGPFGAQKCTCSYVDAALPHGANVTISIGTVTVDSVRIPGKGNAEQRSVILWGDPQLAEDGVWGLRDALGVHRDAFNAHQESVCAVAYGGDNFYAPSTPDAMDRWYAGIPGVSRKLTLAVTGNHDYSQGGAGPGFGDGDACWVQPYFGQSAYLDSYDLGQCQQDAKGRPPPGYGFGVYVIGEYAFFVFDDAFSIDEYTTLIQRDSLSWEQVGQIVAQKGATVAVIYSHCNGGCYSFGDGTQTKYNRIQSDLKASLSDVTFITNHTHLNESNGDGYIAGGNGHTAGCSGSPNQECACSGCCCPTLLQAPQEGKHRISLGGWAAGQACAAIAEKYDCDGSNAYSIAYALRAEKRGDTRGDGAASSVVTRFPPAYLQDDYEDKDGSPIFAPIVSQNARWGDTSESEKQTWMDAMAVRRGYPSCIAGALLGWYSGDAAALAALAESGQCYLPADPDLGHRRFCRWSRPYADVLPDGATQVCISNK